MIIFKGQMRKIRGALCNTLVTLNDIWRSIPKCGRSSEVNLKTLMFQEHVFFEPTFLEKIFEALCHLKGNDELNRYIKINMINICRY